MWIPSVMGRISVCIDILRDREERCQGELPSSTDSVVEMLYLLQADARSLQRCDAEDT